MTSTLFLVNRIAELRSQQATTGLVRESARRGDTWIAQADGFSASGAGVRVVAAQVPAGTTHVRGLRPSTRCEIGVFDRVLVRLNPARDDRPWLGPWLLDILREAEADGVTVINTPHALNTFGTKSGLRHLPADWVPPSLITTHAADLEAFTRSRERTVLKPAAGTQGQSVFIVRRDDDNIRALIELMAPSGPTVAQEWLPEGVDGDQRIILVDGEILEVDGRPAAVRRRPKEGELRSNVHLGGVPEVGCVTERERALVAACGPVLREAGVRVAGLDCIGGKIIEVNVWSPGGFRDMAVLQDLPENAFYSAVLDTLL